MLKKGEFTKKKEFSGAFQMKQITDKWTEVKKIDRNAIKTRLELSFHHFLGFIKEKK